MKKEEIQLFAKALIPSMKKLIKAEVKKVIKPMLKEYVKNEVNQILAEQFINSLAGSKSTNLTEALKIEPEEERRPSRREISESRKREIIKKMGADSDPNLKLIFEDVEMDEGPSVGYGNYFDPLEGDDEGVDLSQFGF